MWDSSSFAASEAVRNAPLRGRDALKCAPNNGSTEVRYFLSVRTGSVRRADGIGEAGFAEEASGFFGRSGIDVEAGAPFEAGDFCELGNDFDVPVIVVVDFLADGRSVNHEIVSGTVEHDVEAHERVFHHAREAGIDGTLVVFVGRAVDFR